jgi:hypothetical protein
MSAAAAAAEAPAGRERRRFPRGGGPFDGSWAGAAGNGTARVWDLSVGGCCIDAPNDQRSGEVLGVAIGLPGGTVRAAGEIVPSVPNRGFAVTFMEMADPSRVSLGLAVDRLLAEGSGT